MRRLAAALASLCLAFMAHAAPDPQVVLHLLDYVGVDYAVAVEEGRVKSEDEYREMREFAGRIVEGVDALAPNDRRAGLAAQARALAAAIDSKADAEHVSSAAAKLRDAIVEAYGLVLAPRAPPDVAKGKSLFSVHCASCHGAGGHGDGAAARGFETRPSDFHDADRMARRSAYGLYSTITLGVSGTPMPSFKSLSEDDRWALAFYVATLRTPSDARDQAAWARERNAAFAKGLDAAATLSPLEFEARFGKGALAVQRYLLAHPEAVQPSPIAVARARIADALNAYRAGRVDDARKAALSAYLDGFELAEASLGNVDAELMRTIEREMLDFRAALDRGETAALVEDRATRAERLLAQAQARLANEGMSPATAFASSFLILLREGLEAILVLSAIVAFVARSGRRDALPWVHAGWVGALLLGGATWAAAAWLVNISGAQRELAEGITALIATGMLLYVGYWLHGKAYAAAWSRFIRERVDGALGKGTLGSIAVLSFIAVYREIFEVVLFYQALWVQAAPEGAGAVIGGAVAALAALAALGFAIFRYSVRLPIGPFFAVMSVLMALLAVVFAGNGIAALQEAGLLDVTRVGFASIPLLGVHPTLETLAAQAAALAIAAGLFLAARRAGSHTAVA
jgi:high-affinity iron transporter